MMREVNDHRKNPNTGGQYPQSSVEPLLTQNDSSPQIKFASASAMFKRSKSVATVGLRIRP